MFGGDVRWLLMVVVDIQESRSDVTYQLYGRELFQNSLVMVIPNSGWEQGCGRLAQDKTSRTQDRNYSVSHKSG